MAPHSSTLAWKIPWTEEPGRLQSMGLRSQTRLSNFTFTFHFHALEKEMATHSSVLAWRISKDRGAWWAAVYGVAQSRTRLKRLSSSSYPLSLPSFLRVSVVQSCLTLCNPMDCSLPGSSVHGIFQPRILEWVSISSSKKDGKLTRLSNFTFTFKNAKTISILFRPS